MIDMIRMIKMTKMINMIKSKKVIKVRELINITWSIKMKFCIDDKCVKDFLIIFSRISFAALVHTSVVVSTATIL